MAITQKLQKIRFILWPSRIVSNARRVNHEKWSIFFRR